MRIRIRRPRQPEESGRLGGCHAVRLDVLRFDVRDLDDVP
jgi:hypothetical protein